MSNAVRGAQRDLVPIAKWPIMPRMSLSRPQIQEIYSNRTDSYNLLISAFRYPQGTRAVLAESGVLRSGLRVLDAGCGFGAATFAFVDALHSKGLNYEILDAFDLTPAMLFRFRARLEARRVSDVRVHQADVTALEQLPSSRTAYDLVLSAGMLEHLPKDELPRALSGLYGLLAPGGRIVAFITKKSPETKILIGSWLHSEPYTQYELQRAFDAGGLKDIVFGKFPWSYCWLNRALHVVIAKSARSTC